MVSTRAFHLCDSGLIPGQCSYQIKNSICMVACEKSVSSFLRVLQFPSVQTLD